MRFRLPPRSLSRTSLRGYGGTKTEKFSLHFLIFSRPIFSFKRKRKFFCFVFLLIREKRKRSIFNRKRVKIFTPRLRSKFAGRSPDPPSFLPACFLASPKFFQKPTLLLFIVTLAPPLPCAGNRKELPIICLIEIKK